MELAWSTQGDRSDTALQHVTRLYSDSDGSTHFQDVYLCLGDGGTVAADGIGALCQRFPAASVRFRWTPGTYDYPWHNAPAKQLIVMLDAGVRVTASDGETRDILAGEILLVEDTTGKGHWSRAIDGKPRRSLFIELPAESC